MSQPSPPPTKPTTKRKLKRWLGCAGVVLMVIVLLAIGSLWLGRHLWQSEPDYWTANQVYAATDINGLTDTADRAFNRVLSELSNSHGYKRGDDTTDPNDLGTRTIYLSFEEANAWLATRLKDWLVNQRRELPAGVSDPMLTGDGESLVAAFRYQNQAQQIDQVFSVLMSLRFLEDGRATLQVDRIYGGRLWLPTDAVMGQLSGLAGENESRSHIIAVLLGQESFDPILPIDGTRRARIVGMDVDEHGVSLTVRAEEVE